MEPSWLGSLEAIGEVALVGGAVRDALLGVVPRDCDLCVKASKADFDAWVSKIETTPTSFAARRVRAEDALYDVWRLADTRGIVGWTFEDMLATFTLSSDMAYVTRTAENTARCARTIRMRELDTEHPEQMNDRQTTKAYLSWLRYGWLPTERLLEAARKIPHEAVATHALERYGVVVDRSAYERWLL